MLCMVAASKPTAVCLQTLVSRIVILTATVSVASLLFVADGVIVAVVMLSHADHCMDTHRLLPPVVWVVGSVPVRTVSATCPHRNNNSNANHDFLPATFAMFVMRSCLAR